MTPERRTHARGKTTAKVTFTDATSEQPSEGELHDIGRGGMFVATKTPLPVGKRIDFEVHATGGAPIVGMARVIWVRETAAADLPAGMGIKYIDVDDTALVAIDRLVGLKKNVRERTVLGIQAPVVPVASPKVEAPKVEAPKVEAPKVEAPKVEAPKVEPPRPIKSRERTVLGIAPPAQPREEELAWPEDPPAPPPEPEKKAEPVVAKEPEPEPVKEVAPEPVVVKEPEPEPVKEVAAPAVAAPEPVKEAPPKKAPVSAPEPRELPKREGGGAGKWILLVLVLGGAGAAYYFRDKILPPSAPTPTPTVSVSATTSAPSATTSASAAPSASAMEIADASSNVADATAVETIVDTTPADAGIHDGGHDGGDGGKHHHDAGGAATTTTTQHHAKPKPSATATSTAADNPY